MEHLAATLPKKTITPAGTTPITIELFQGREYSQHKVDIAASEIRLALAHKTVCLQCKGLEACPFPVKGHKLKFDLEASDMYDFPTFAYQQCTTLQSHVTVERVKQSMDKRFQGRTFEDYDKELNPTAYQKCFTYAQSFNWETTNGLMLSGPVGVGKTHLAAAILHVVIAKGIAGAMVVVPNLLDEIKFTFNDPSADKRLAQKLAEKHFIVLDDMGAEKVTDWAKNEIYKLVNKRYEQELPTIITTNCTFGELAAAYGDRTADRLSEMCDPVVVAGPSFRRKRR